MLVLPLLLLLVVVCTILTMTITMTTIITAPVAGLLTPQRRRPQQVSALPDNRGRERGHGAVRAPGESTTTVHASKYGLPSSMMAFITSTCG